MNDGLIVTPMMEAVRISETSVCYNETTRRNIPEEFSLHTRRRENLKPHIKETWKTASYKPKKDR
jgi:hypothetical protein